MIVISGLMQCGGGVRAYKHNHLIDSVEEFGGKSGVFKTLHDFLPTASGYLPALLTQNVGTNV
jgi:hypothetical protein